MHAHRQFGHNPAISAIKSIVPSVKPILLCPPVSALNHVTLPDVRAKRERVPQPGYSIRSILVFNVLRESKSSEEWIAGIEKSFAALTMRMGDVTFYGPVSVRSHMEVGW